MSKKKKPEDLLKTGRPPKFDNPEMLERLIDEYFEKGGTSRTFIVGSGANKRDVTINIVTITGLCLYCGFESRQSFYDYEEKPGFTYIIKRARIKIERMYEENLQYGNTIGSIFALKNMGWHDRTELTGRDGREIEIEVSVAKSPKDAQV